MHSLNKKPKYTVAILDDCSTTRRVTALILQTQLGCQVDTYHSGEQLLMIPSQHMPNLFLLDVVMEDIDGIEICNRLKKRKDAADIPVIFFSAHCDAQTRVKALQSGGSDYIDKPFYPEELVARVKSHIDIYLSRLEIIKKADQQQALLRVLCHDLQNPVASVFSLLDYVNSVKEYNQEMMDLAIGSAQSALDLIAHVREFQSLMHGYKDFSIQLVSIQEAIEESFNIIAPLAKSKNIEFQCEISENIILKINRVVFIHNIINNLLTNALKFSNPDSVVIVRIHTVNESDLHRCVIEVIDEGIGIPVSIQTTLFEASLNRSRAGTSAEVGTGFGMPLVKVYVDLFDGVVEVESPVKEKLRTTMRGPGTCVRISFPLSPMTDEEMIMLKP